MTLPASVATALAALHDAIASLSPEDQTRMTYALQALEPVVADEIDKATATYLHQLPVFGGVADDLVNAAVSKALEDGLAQLTAAKSAIGA